MGDKYGNCPLPAVLSVAHYDLFIDKLSKAKRVEDINLLKEWYKLDTNAVPAHYILMPLSEKYLQTETGEGKIEELKAQVNCDCDLQR